MQWVEFTNFVYIEVQVDNDDYKGPCLIRLEFSLVLIQYSYFVGQLKGFPKRLLDLMNPFGLLFLLCPIGFHRLGV